eukprot:GHVU01143930.1.p1 GENE.GHVU01143930.1~~GHVU01143930.1.p1  ORF type:complete len:393 (-),score=91.15 GHVU01143930.1:362-1540(-)
MEKLTKFIDCTYSQLTTNMEAEHDASPEEITKYTTSVMNYMKQLTSRAPPEVKQKMMGCTEGIWDIKTNKQVVAEMTVELLEKMLKSFKTTFPLENHNRAETKPSEMKHKITVLDEELKDVRVACQKLWDLDTNRLDDDDIKLNLQSQTRPGDPTDRAKESLFSYISKKAISKKTIKTFSALFDNYESQVGKHEVYTKAEEAETAAFIDAIGETEIIHYLYLYAAKKGVLRNKGSYACFLEELAYLWFTPYKRAVRDDSSGFEHVFIGEERDGKVIGFHNWIRFMWEEANKRVDYKGYIPSRRRSGHRREAANDRLVTIKFAWGNETKDVGSMFVGTSPEFEIALYTLLFLESKMQGGNFDVDIDGYPVRLTVHPFRTRFGCFIGSAYPSAL